MKNTIKNKISKAAVSALILIINCTISIVNCNAQTATVTNLSSSLIYASETAGLSDDLLENVPRKVEVTATLSGTENVTAVILTVGSADGSNDLSTQTYPISGTGIPNGSSYSRSGNTITITSASFQSGRDYFVGLSLKFNNAQDSPLVTDETE